MIDKTPAQKIISFLQQRKGFDYWWRDIEKDVQDQILEEIAQIIDEHSSIKEVFSFFKERILGIRR